jgi:nitric oxide reductase NorE protein
MQASSSAKSGTAGRIPGEAGVWVFILGDLNVFAVFFIYFLVQRRKQPDLFAESQEVLNRNF